jgi:T4 RnlA family RNA ligase
LRGLTFVFNKDGSLFERFLLMDKFWNMNQSEDSMYSVIKDYKIKTIYNKEDGSIASFIKLPNGKVIAKSKASFESSQAKEIQKIYDRWPNIKKFVDMCLDQDLMPIFEYVSPTNRIVLPYANTDLILLRVRDNKTGVYHDLDEFVDDLDGITVAPTHGETLDDLIELKEVTQDKEGWIVQFENGKMVKIKTQWYQDLHKLFTEDINKEHTLVSLILNDTIDDVIAQLPEDDVMNRENINNIIDLLNKDIQSISKEVDYIVGEYKGDKKEFAIKHHKNEYFDIAIGVLFRGKDQMELVKNYILKMCMRQEKAREYLRSIGWNPQDYVEFK